MASRNIEDLDLNLQPLCRDFLQRCEDSGIHVIITCTYRSNEEQNELYAQGRTKPGKIVTKAIGGKSKHNFTLNGKPYARAFDIVPVVNGKAIWDEDNPIWARIAKIYKFVGNSKYELSWYGEKGSEFYELYHFQLKEKTL
jgi:peptidoglycan L-alanyl-D-glutamate endopeptidase CwlK